MSAVRQYLKVLVDSMATYRGVDINTYNDYRDITDQFSPAWIVYVQSLNEDEDDNAQNLYDFIMDLLGVPTDDLGRDLTIEQQKALFATR